MTFNAASRLRSLEDRSAALGSSRCELPGMHSVPKSAVLPYASGVGGLSRRLLNKDPTDHGFWYPPSIGPCNQNVGSLCSCGLLGPYSLVGSHYDCYNKAVQ